MPYLNRNVRKRTFEHVRPVKIQIRLRIRAVWSETSLGAFWIANDAKFLHAEVYIVSQIRGIFQFLLDLISIYFVVSTFFRLHKYF